MKYVTPLSDADIETVQQRHAPHPARRARMRAHSLLLSHQRYPIPPMARLSQVDPRRVSAWRDRWQAWGLVGFYDRPRRGRPAICTAAEPQKVSVYLHDSPKTSSKSSRRWSKRPGSASVPKPSNVSSKKATSGNGSRTPPHHLQPPTHTAGAKRCLRACKPVQAQENALSGIVMVQASASSRLSLTLGSR
jgi:Helix-turn-helix domain